MTGSVASGGSVAALSPSELLAQYGVIVMPNLNDTYELTGANVQKIGMVGIVVTIFNKDGLPAVGAPVVVNEFPDGRGDEPATPDGAGQVRFSASAASAYTPPQRGPFTVTLVDTATKDDTTKLIHIGTPLSPSVQGMGDHNGDHTLWSLQFRERGSATPPPPPPPTDLPVVNTDDDRRELALNNIYPPGIRWLNTAALVLAARNMNFGVPCTNEGRYVDSAGVRYAWQGFVGGILYCVEGQWDRIKVTIW